MIPEETVIRVDATSPPAAAPGDTIHRGQRVCTETTEPVYPISGTIRSIHFDPESHEFVILVTADCG